MKTFLALTLASVFGLATAGAQIIVGNTLSGQYFATPVAGSSTTSSSLNVGSASDTILMVAISTQEGNGNTGVSGVKFGTTALIQGPAVTQGFNRWSAEIWYLTNPTGTEALTVDHSAMEVNGDGGFVISAAAFSGVDLTDPFLATATATDAEPITLTYDLGASPVDTVFFESFSANNGSGMTLIPTGATALSNNLGSGNPLDWQGYDPESGLSGIVNRTFDGGANNQAIAGVALAAAVIPEPSSALLLVGAGLGTLLLRRRRAGMGA